MNKNKILINIIFWIICLIILGIIVKISQPWKELTNRLGMFFQLGILIDLIMLGIVYSRSESKMRINTNVKKTEKTIYHREPPFDYSPVIITYLQNLKIEFKKDIVAEIAFLINKKILKLEKINNEYYIDFGIKQEKVTLDSQSAILKYIPGKIKLQDLIKELEKHKHYIELCYEKDCIDLGYIEKGKVIEKFNTGTLYSITLILLIPTIVIIITMIDKFGFLGMLEIIFLVGIISLAYSVPFISITNIVKTRTQKAKQEYAEWLAFIDFIKDYSYLNERKLQELEIWDDYLTYSIAFGVTKINTLLKM